MSKRFNAFNAMDILSVLHNTDSFVVKINKRLFIVRHRNFYVTLLSTYLRVLRKEDSTIEEFCLKIIIPNKIKISVKCIKLLTILFLR